MINQEKLAFQKETVKKWIETGLRGWLSLPPGIGKSYIAVLAMRKLLGNKPNAKIMVVVPKLPLAKQWIDGYITELKSEFSNSIIEVRTIHSLLQKKGTYNFIVWDEIHKYINGEEFSKSFNNFKAKAQLGLSGSVNNQIESRLNELAFRKVVEMSREEALTRKFLTPTYIYNLAIKPSLFDEAKLYKLTTEIKRDSHKLNGYAAFYLLNPKISENDKKYISSIIGLPWKIIFGMALKIQRLSNERTRIVELHPKKKDAFKQCVEKFPDRQVLTFSKKTAFADQLTELYPNISKSYHSLTPGHVLNANGEVVGESVKITNGKRKSTKTIQTKYKVNNKFYSWEELKTAFPQNKFKRVSNKVVKENILKGFARKDFRILNSALSLQEGIDIKSIDLCFESSRSADSLTLIPEVGRLRSHGGIFIRAYLDSEYSSDLFKLQKTQEESGIKPIDITSIDQINV